LEGPARRSGISNTAIIGLADISPGAAEGDLLAKGQSGNTSGPTRRFHEPGHIGCRAVALPNSVRQLHNSVFQRENSQQFAVLSSEATPSPKDFCGNPGLTG
jgi:hypothetical protein